MLCWCAPLIAIHAFDVACLTYMFDSPSFGGPVSRGQRVAGLQLTAFRTLAPVGRSGYSGTRGR